MSQMNDGIRINFLMRIKKDVSIKTPLMHTAGQRQISGRENLFNKHLIR
jgi:hypothetical protein